MDTLLHNPIADMFGPSFLLFYGSAIAATLIVCWQLIQDPTKNQPLPLIPAEPNPYEIAYLRSQETGVAYLVLFNLIQQGYLHVKEQTISKVPSHPDTSNLEFIEQQVFEKFSEPATAKTSLWLATQCVQPFCIAYQEQLDNEKLLCAAKWQEWNIKVGLIGGMIIFSLGGYKLLIALGKGRYNVGFLIVMGVCSIIYLLWFVSKKSALSHLGKRYLQQLQTTFAQLIKKARYSIPSLYDYNLLIAIFGVEALAGTSYDAYYKAFFAPKPNYSYRTSSRSTSKASHSSSGSSSSDSSCSSSFGWSSCSSSSSDSSCSSSSNSSCSSGSSCGSSCGGGCGGCGGGCGG